MPAPLKVKLSEEEDRKLLEFKQNSKIPQRVRDRAEMVRLNAYGWSVEQSANYLKKSPHTVRSSIHRWQKEGMEGFWEAEGRGRKTKWSEEDWEFLEKCLEQEPRTYNSKQLCQKLERERGVKLSADRIRKLLKKKGGVGKEQDTSNRQRQTL